MRSPVFPFNQDSLSPDGPGTGDVMYETNTPSCSFSIEPIDEYLLLTFSLLYSLFFFFSHSLSHTLSLLLPPLRISLSLPQILLDSGYWRYRGTWIEHLLAGNRKAPECGEDFRRTLLVIDKGHAVSISFSWLLEEQGWMRGAIPEGPNFKQIHGFPKATWIHSSFSHSFGQIIFTKALHRMIRCAEPWEYNCEKSVSSIFSSFPSREAWSTKLPRGIQFLSSYEKHRI